jgi:hypothetical protein
MKEAVDHIIMVAHNAVGQYGDPEGEHQRWPRTGGTGGTGQATVAVAVGPDTEKRAPWQLTLDWCQNKYGDEEENAREHDRGTHRQSEPKRAIARALPLLVLRQAECLEVLLTMHPTLFTVDTYL